MAPSTRPSFYARALAAFLGAPRRWQVALVLLMVMVCFLAFAPHPPERASFGWDKLNHSVAFTVLTIAACFGFPSRQHVWPVMLAMLGFGMLVEVVQAYVPGRSAELADLAADTLGIVAGACLALPLLRFARPQRA